MSFNNECLSQLRQFTIGQVDGNVSLISQTNGSFSSFTAIMYQIAASTLELASTSNNCFQSPTSSSFWTKTAKFLRFISSFETISSIMNTSSFVVKMSLAPASFDFCLSAQGNAVSECNNLIGTWKSTSILWENQGNEELITPCSANDELKFLVNGEYNWAYNKLFDNVCIIETEAYGTYTTSSNIIDFSANAIGQPFSAQIMLNDETTLKIRFVDGSDTYLQTFTRQQLKFEIHFLRKF